MLVHARKFGLYVRDKSTVWSNIWTVSETLRDCNMAENDRDGIRREDAT
jgi:hypothetical protein